MSHTAAEEPFGFVAILIERDEGRSQQKQDNDEQDENEPHPCSVFAVLNLDRDKRSRVSRVSFHWARLLSIRSRPIGIRTRQDRPLALTMFAWSPLSPSSSEN